MSKKRKGLLQRILMLMLVVCMVCGNGITALADEAVASTMRLTKTEGTVSVTNKNGRDMGTMADMKLFNGYHLTTAQKSYAWMNLDDHKLVKLDAVSEAEIQKKGKDLEVLLNSGNLLFNVTESLKADETLNVRTSTMVTGIRGTCGWVKVLDASRTQVHILEGQVECYVMDPVSGQYKSVVLRSGETAEFVVYDQTRVGDKCDILINRFSEKDIPGFVAVELMNDSDLRDRITGVMNIDMNWIFGNGPTVLDQDQKNVEQKFAPINEAVKQQDHKVTKDPLFGNNDDDDDDNDGGGSGGGSSSTTPPSDPSNPSNPSDPTDPEENLTEKTLTVTEAETDDQLNYYLSMSSMEKVTIIPSDNDDTLDIRTTTTVASGQTLQLENVDLMIEDTAELRINGELTVPYDVVNFGTITNTSLNSFVIQGMLTNEEGATIENTGKIDADGMMNHGAIISSGRLIGDMTVSRLGSLDLLADDDYGTLEGTLTVEGRPDQSGYVTLYQNMPTSLVMNGGTVEFAGANADEIEIANGRVVVSSGSIINDVKLSDPVGVLTVAGGTVDNVEAEGGVLNMNSGALGVVQFIAGNLNATGGTVDFVGASVDTMLTVSGGNIGAIDLNGAQYNNGDGTISITGANGTLEVENGKLKSAALSDYDENAVGDVLTTISGDTIGTLEQYSGTLEITGGEVTDVKMIDTILSITGGEVEILEISYYTVQDVTIEGGEIKNLQITWPEDGEPQDMVLFVGESDTTKASIGKATLSEMVGFTMAGGKVSELIAEDEVSIAYGTVDKMIVNGGTVNIGDDIATEDNTKINTGEITVNNGELTMNEGTHGKVILDSSLGSIYGGMISKGLFVKGELLSSEPLVNIYGGTVSSGESYAAITVDTMIPEGGFDYTDYGYQVGNVAIYGGTIDGQTNSAIEVVHGELIIELIDLSEPNYKDDMIPVIRGSNLDELFLVPSDAENNLRIWFGELTEDGELNSEEKRYTEESYLFFNQDEDGYKLKRMTDGFVDALESIQGEECLVLKKDVTVSQYDYAELYLNPAYDELSRIPAALDLNGYELTIEPYIYLGFGDSDDNSSQYGLKIFDSKESGTLSLGGLQNSAALTLDGIFYTHNSNNPISNKAVLNINNSELNATNCTLIQNCNGTLTVSGNSALSAQYTTNSSDYLEANTIRIDGGQVILGSTDSDKVEVTCDGGEQSSAIYMAYYVTGDENTLIPVANPQLRMSYSAVSSEDNVAIYADTSATIVLNEGAVVESGNDSATIYLASEINNESVDNMNILSFESPKVTLNAGTIINDGNGYPIVWDTNVGDSVYEVPDFSEWSFLTNNNNINEDPAFVIKNPDKTVIKMEKDAESVLYECCYQIREDGERADIKNRHLIPDGYKLAEDNNGYLVLEKELQNQSFLAFLKDTSNSTMSEDIETASNATPSDATVTPSNASGTPTTSKSAIPMAVAMLAGLMAIAPKLFEDSEDKKRKER